MPAKNLYSLRCEMPARCVVYGCSNTPDAVNQIALQPIPYYGDLRPEAVKRGKHWIDFVKLKRAGWDPSRQSHVCSKHFKADDFVRTLNLPGLEQRTFPRLKTDELGVTAYPGAKCDRKTGEFICENCEGISTQGEKSAFYGLILW